MSEMKEKYINLFTDYGFKRVFGTDINKDLLIDFLNELLEKKEGKIVNLTYLTSEQIGYTETDRKAIFDLYCENEKGEKFIVELQKARQNYFKDRSVFYATFPIQSQAKKGEWDYNLKAVYAIGILDFIFDKDTSKAEKENKIVTTVKLTDIETNKVFYDKLTFVYIEIPKFNKNIEELDTRFDKWLYSFKYLHRLQDRPKQLQESIFNRLFEIAEIAKLTQDEYFEYESSMKYWRDYKNTIDTAKEEGMIEGEKRKTHEIAINCLKNNIDFETISILTGLTKEEIESLKE
ncbi:MAG: PD-(D/E)XK nuclease family transposase [Candidatus Delongbacteria bacterium]|nr:PD-(D/E)XK nuclease family transposase [Candidatus Delongbacteria bacterium]MBN2834494.1 PD-(D/E)XK nuclease family transposase [Candidatus Delongbacteria bacterium]